MKKRFLIPAAGVLLAIGVIVFLTQKTPKPPEIPQSPSDQLVLNTSTDPTLVFQKAFWRRPAGDDKILHAERREWSEQGKVVREWQWFLAVQPSPGLSEWLQTNPFSLPVSSDPFEYKEAAAKPDWFPNDFSGFEILKAPQSRLVLIFSAEKNLLYAMDFGAGFAPPTAKLTN
jgi:hypothetical protein